MKREAFDHPKFRLLGRDLGLCMAFTRGIVESLWIITARNFPQGDIGRWSNEEIAVSIDYPGDADALIAALIKRRLVDQTPTCRLSVHDWHEHADAHVHATLAKAGKYFVGRVEPKIPHNCFDYQTRQRIKSEYDSRRTPGELPENSPAPPVTLPKHPESSPSQTKSGASAAPADY